MATSKSKPDQQQQDPAAPPAEQQPESAAAPAAAPQDTAAAPSPVPAGQVAQTAAGPKVERRMIDALLDERAGYVAAGRDDRVTAVDKQLAAYGTTYEQALLDRDRREAHPEWTDPVEVEQERQRVKMIDALLDERAGYERQGMDDRVKAVDGQLRERGTTYEQAAKDRAERTERDAAPTQPENPRAAEQQTR